MASTTLVPTAISDPNANIASGVVGNIDNTIASANDTALVTTVVDQFVSQPGTVTFTMSDLPGDFGSVNTVQFRVRGRFVNPGSGDQAQYDFAVAGTNAPSTTASWDETDAGAGFANRGAGSPVSSSASQSDINGWTVTLQQPAAQYVKDKGFDNLYLDISEIEIIVDYNVSTAFNADTEGKLALRALTAGSKTYSADTEGKLAFRPISAFVPSPRVWLNTSQSLSGATEMPVTAFSVDGTSVTFNDAGGLPIGNLFLGVENRSTGSVGWIAVTVDATFTATVKGGLSIRQALAGSKTYSAAPVGRLSLRATVAATAAAVIFNASVLVRMAVRSVSQFQKTAAAAPASRLSLRALVASTTGAAFNAAVRASLALRPASSYVLGPTVWLNTSQSLVGATQLEVTAWNLTGTSVTFNDAVGLPVGNLFLGVQNMNTLAVGWIAVTVDATFTATVRGGLSIRQAVAAAKTSTGAPLARFSLRALIAAGAAGAYNAAVRAGISIRQLTAAAPTKGAEWAAKLLIRSTDDGSKTAAAAPSARLSVRQLLAAAKTAAGAVTARISLRALVSGAINGVFNAAVRASVSLRQLVAAAKTSSAAPTARTAIRASQQAQKTTSAAPAGRLSLRGIIDAGSTAFFAAAVRVALSLRGLQDTSATKVAAVRAGLALRALDNAGTIRGASILARAAIRASNSGDKAAAGVSFNRFGFRAQTGGTLGEQGTIARVVELSGIFDHDVLLTGIWTHSGITAIAGSGAHTGANNSSYCYDGDFFAFGPEGSQLGRYIRNVTDGSDWAAITAQTPNRVDHEPLTGGTDNDWDAGDVWQIGVYYDHGDLALDGEGDPV